MRRLFRRLLRGRRGQNTIEFALALVFVLLPLLVGVVDIGRSFYSYISITNAAREGARYASRFPWLGNDIRDTVINELAGTGITLVRGDITIKPDPPPNALPNTPGVAQPGQTIWVGVTYKFDTIMGELLGLPSLTLRAATRMVVFGTDLPSTPTPKP